MPDADHRGGFETQVAPEAVLISALKLAPGSSDASIRSIMDSVSR